MTTIKILGTGCAKCKSTYNNVLKAIEESGAQANVIKVEDITEIMTYNVMSTPALVVDEVIKIKGRVPDVSEIKAMLRSCLTLKSYRISNGSRTCGGIF